MAALDRVVLGPALEAARRSLRFLDTDQIPADLRPVAGHSGRLTPNLAGVVVRALERYDWLRTGAAEAWPEADVDAGGAEGASALFLLRPEGWELRLASIALTLGEQAAVRSGARGDEERAALEAERDRLRSRLKEDRKAAEERERALAAELEDLRGIRRSAAASEATARGGRRREAERSAARIAELEDSLREVEGKLRTSREDLRVERRARAAAESAAVAAVPRPSWAGEDPLELAVRLDEMAVMARPPASGEAVAAGEAVAMPIPTLPAGISPDSAEAMAWVIRNEEPTTLVVDGYNAGFALVGGGRPAEARRRLEPILERAGRLGGGRLRVIVVYDSAGDPEPSLDRSRSVEVRFASAEATADEEIAALTAEIGGRVVVVSSDREVRVAAERHGALALWSQALLAWADRR